MHWSTTSSLLETSRVLSKGSPYNRDDLCQYERNCAKEEARTCAAELAVGSADTLCVVSPQHEKAGTREREK
jgi:hypothetical protein